MAVPLPPKPASPQSAEEWSKYYWFCLHIVRQEVVEAMERFKLIVNSQAVADAVGDKVRDELAEELAALRAVAEPKKPNKGKGES